MQSERRSNQQQQAGGPSALPLSDDSRSPVGWLVLALLIEQPSHGYELSQRYEQRFGSFASHSVPRIYAALERLNRAGMIEPTTLKPANPTGRQHLMRRSYRATPAGAEAYRQWVADRLLDDPQRVPLLARIASAGWLDLDAVLEVIDRYQSSCVEALRALPTTDEKLEAGHASLEQLTQHLLTDQQRRELRARHDWAVHARQLVETHQRQHIQQQPADTDNEPQAPE
jgi:DNA-binding PadR family transcriptional regulator